VHITRVRALEESVNVYFAGTAGCGKSTLTSAFDQWLETQGYDSVLVNLDPGAEALPYESDIDIREWVKLRDIMDEYGLGPNGAQIAAADLLALNAPEVKKVIDEFETDYIVFDTPGQLELFTFRESSNKIIECFGKDKSLMCFLMDPMLARNPNGFVSSLLLAITTNFRLSIPMLTMISKSDLLSEEEIERIQSWSADFYNLQNSLTEQVSGAQNQVSIELLKAIETTIGGRGQVEFVSSETMTGIEDIYDFIQEITMGGEDLEPR